MGYVTGVEVGLSKKRRSVLSKHVSTLSPRPCDAPHCLRTAESLTRCTALTFSLDFSVSRAVRNNSSLK